MNKTLYTTLILLQLSLGACQAKESREENPLPARDTTQLTPTPEEQPSPKTLEGKDIQLEKALEYDKHTLEDTYTYKKKQRSFKWDQIKEQLAVVENMLHAQEKRWVVFQNYKNCNGESPTVKDFVRDEYGRVSDHNGVARYQAVPLYEVGDTTTVVAYGRDGWLAHLQDSIGNYYRVHSIRGEEVYLTPKKLNLTMNLSFFDQFTSPSLLGIPLILLSLLFPALLFPSLDNR